MTKRENRFAWSGSILFVFAYWFLSTIMEAAKDVGDAPADMETCLKSIAYSLTLVAGYAVIYYLTSLVIHFIRKKNITI